MHHTALARDRRTITRKGFAVLVALVVADLAFISLHIVHTHVQPALGLFDDPLMSLAKDRGYSEAFGYAQLLFASLVLLTLHHQTRRPVYLGWAFTLALILIDDSFTVHERLGGFFAERFDLQPAFGLRAQDFGELTTWGLLTLLIVAALLLTRLRTAVEDRRDSRALLLLLLTLAIFSVGFDMLHVALTGWKDIVAGIIEDGGELMVTSGIVAHTVVLGLRHRRAASSVSAHQAGEVSPYSRSNL